MTKSKVAKPGDRIRITSDTESYGYLTLGNTHVVENYFPPSEYNDGGVYAKDVKIPILSSEYEIIGPK